MKVTIVTVHDSANFGSFLQAYALDVFLKKHGFDTSFLITRDKKYVKNLFFNLKPNGQWIKHPINTFKAIKGGMEKFRIFKKELSCFSECDINDGDITVLGSDEIWNIKTPVFNKPLFYGKDMKNVVAYAVSAGLATYEDFENKKELKSLIRNIEDPLVRDENTADCVEKITGQRPSVVCDPTLLISKDEFKREFHDEYLENNDCIVVYAYQPEEKVQKLFKDFAKKHGLKLVSVGFSYHWCDYSILCSPLEFCAVMEKAKYVITTTFHGSIFSVLNHKQFLSIPLSGKTNDILKRLGLSDIAVSFDELSESVMEEKLFKTNIDYNAVDEKINIMKMASARLLEERLERFK